MDYDTTPFAEFFTERFKEKGTTLKRLSDATGIAPSHIEAIMRGDFASMPSAPYFRGYLIRLGKELDFNGEEWWMRLKNEGVIQNSGELDTLPRNRFIKKAPPKYLWAIGVAVIVLIYLAFQLPRILGKPSLSVTFPVQSPYTTTSSTLTISGTVSNADSLYLNNNQQIPIAADGSWSENVLLGAGANPFEITAKKFLGGSTQITEQIIYQPGNTPVTTISTSTASSTTTTGSSSATSTH
jgi:cytoskeletal protein RodZ